MATTTDPRPSPSEARRQRIAAGRQRPAGGIELGMWLFMRLSGLLLVVLAVGHVLIMHLVDDGVGRVDFAFVAVRWQSPFWRTWDWMMLVLALIHGIFGLRNIAMDYLRPPGARFAVTVGFYTIGFAMFVLGTVVVFTFDPSSWPGALSP